MKLTCVVEINYRLQPHVKRKASKSVLALGKKPNDELFIIHFTSTNKTGTKYDLKENIEKVFTKFVNAGKCTLRFKQPPHDLFVQAETVELKLFLKTLQLAIENKVPRKDLSLAQLSVVNVKTKISPTSMVVTRQTGIPKNGLPRTLEKLQINEFRVFNLNVIGNLIRLRILDLSHNKFNSFPTNIFNSLVKLKELNLSDNNFNECRDWTWLNSHVQIQALDLSNNHLQRFPGNLLLLKNLCHLNISSNNLKKLPSSLGKMRSLKHLNVANNSLESLPASFLRKPLDVLDISGNCFVPREFHLPDPQTDKESCRKLIDLSARKILECNIYYDYESLPRTVIEYLNTAKYCLCGRPIFGQFVNYVSLNSRLSHVNILRTNVQQQMTVEYQFCNYNCYLLHKPH